MAQPPQKPGGLGPARLGADKPRAGLESAAEAAGQSHGTDVLAETCQHLEESLEELKVKYEMYFLGVERLEPVRRRDDLKRDIARLKTAFTRNTGLRFRIQSLHARYLSYERMWVRAARQREEGTYRRDLFKARLRTQGRPEPGKGKEKRPGAPAGEDVDIADLTPRPWTPGAKPGANGPATPEPRAQARGDGASPATPSPGPPPARPGAAPGGERPSPGALGDSQMRALYDAFLTAKKRCNEDTSRLTFDSLAKSVNKQIPELMTRFQARAVDFKVVIKDGKAMLKAVPRT
ncbi:MAG TPA: MXAN_5187 C-terminal domain-containing protein [Anaeromyxobacteraceae bacterium]|nr:MXAN_5187 C-terminal domain-containing protein [Anaeromyxobacteraceae bacterium]